MSDGEISPMVTMSPKSLEIEYFYKAPDMLLQPLDPFSHTQMAGREEAEVVWWPW